MTQRARAILNFSRPYSTEAGGHRTIRAIPDTRTLIRCAAIGQLVRTV